MQELVGRCRECGKEIFCLDGFLNGVSENGRLVCFDCSERDDRSAEPQPGT